MLNDNRESIQETFNRFIDKGVKGNKITLTNNPSVVTWSLTRKCIVGGESKPPYLEIINTEDGNMKLTYENNRSVSLQIRTELTEADVEEINQSEGIIVTNATYGHKHFRYGFIPTE